VTKWPARIAAGAALLGGLALLAWSLTDPSADPPLDSVQHNPAGERPQPQPAFVDTLKCRECHPDEFAAHAQHGHASTLTRSSESKISRQLAGRTIRDPQRNVVFQYGLNKSGELQVRSDSYAPKTWFPLQFAFGSGMHAGVTWVTVITANTQVPIAIEHRLSWVSKTQDMRVTPGQDGRPIGQRVEIFGHPHLTEDMKRCFDCHSTHYKVLGTRIVDLQAGVHCQNCHGPGADHVAAMEAGASETRLRFPQKDSTAMDEIRLCGTCHRLPKDLSPDQIVRSNRELPRMQSVALLQSRCFQQSDGLRCSTCHDTHASAQATTRAAYEQSCVSCHDQPTQTTCATAAKTGCVQCHMPQIDVNPGMPFHDHWIRVRNDEDPQPITVQNADHTTDDTPQAP